MKLRFKWIALPLLVLASSACEKYLDTPQYGDILPETTEDFAGLIYRHLSTIEGADQLLVGSYRTSADFEAYADNLNANLSTAFTMSMYVGEQLPSLQYRFTNFYSNIKDYNIVLDHIGQPETALEKKLVATARSLRAVTYFNLMREFCEPYDPATASAKPGVPIVETFDLEYLPNRANLRATADFIIADLQAALAIGQTDELYKFTDVVNRAYLARVYYWTQRWQEAAQEAEAVLARYPMVEGDEFVAQVTGGVADKSGSVLIRSYTTGSASGMTTYKRRVASRPVNLAFLKLFAETTRDIRYLTYFDNNLLNLKSPQGWVRSEEMALIAAEAHAHLNNTEKSLEWLNALRAKRIAAYTPLTQASLPAPDAGALVTVDCTGQPLSPLISAILNERRKELYLEGDRWFELKRNGRPEFWSGYSGVKYETKKFLYTFPINRSETILNPDITQNEGYENL